jgi:hypothetical protein
MIKMSGHLQSYVVGYPEAINQKDILQNGVSETNIW